MPAMPRRHEASVIRLRQRGHYREQEQPDVRAVVRKLPLERSRFEPPVRTVLHALAVETNMRRLVSIHVVCWLGLAMSAAAQAQTQAPAPPASSANSASPAAAEAKPDAAA